MDDTLFTLPRFMTPTECSALIAVTERGGYAAAPITTARGFVMAPEVRSNTRFMIDDVDLASVLWGRLARHVDVASEDGWRPVGLNERFRFYRYEPGQAFRWHRDGAFERSEATSPGSGPRIVERSRLTFMVYLNGGFEGGATEFEHTEVVPREGLALVFAHHLRHQGGEVLRGTKYVLRSDVMFRRA